MRSSKNRSRSKSNRQRPLGNIVNRVFESSGPEGKVRGTPQQIIDKYLALARDAQLSNDRVAEQNFLQHAEHYTRLLSEAQREMQREQEARQAQQQQNQQQNQQSQQSGGQAEPGNQQQGGSGEENRNRNRRRNDRETRQRDEALPSVSTKDDDEVLVETPESRIGESQAASTPDQPGAEEPAQGEGSEDEAKPARKRSPRKPRTRKADQAEGATGSEGNPGTSPETPADAAE